MRAIGAIGAVNTTLHTPLNNGAVVTHARMTARQDIGAIVSIEAGYLACAKTPTPLGPPQDPRHRPKVGS